MGIKKQLSVELREDLISFYKDGNPLYEGCCRMGPPPLLYKVFSKFSDLCTGDLVLIEVDRGAFLATVAVGLTPFQGEGVDLEKALGDKDTGVVLRIASDEDRARHEYATEQAQRAFGAARERARKHGLPMKIVRAECALDREKVIVHYTSNSRVDFRGLVRDLADTLKTRVEMRQVGVRDACKMLGGIGICGREACCCSFLTAFQTVIASKLEGSFLQDRTSTGPCGRLLCCLSYEGNEGGCICEESST